jgi:hypothetical protein
VTLKLVTEDRVYGLGDATLNGREWAVAAYLTEQIVPRGAPRIESVNRVLSNKVVVEAEVCQEHAPDYRTPVRMSIVSWSSRS